MKSSCFLACLRLISALTLTWLAAPAAFAADGPLTSKAAFEQLKGLAGEWRGKAIHGGTTNDAVVNYRVIGGGSTVMETLFPGSPHERVTMDHLDGDKLMLTHYCAIGNQPRMVLDLEKSTPKLLVFDFAGGTNLDPAKDRHMHSARIGFTGANSLAGEWSSYQDGKDAGGAQFMLTREPAKK